MSFVNGKERILIHLLKKSSENLGVITSKNHYNGALPYEICQKGIAKEVDLSISRTSRLIKRLKKNGMIKENTRRVEGFDTRRKVYTLTSKGFKKAKKIREKLENKKITLKTRNSDIIIELGQIDSYLDTDNPLLTAINNLEEGTEVYLDSYEVKKKNLFTGRSEEMKYLSEKLRDVLDTGSETILIKGPAGIGKTRLIQELKIQKESDNVDFLMSKGHFKSSEAFLPFKKIFGEFENMFRGTIEKIRSLAKTRRVVIVIDDIHWADRSSLTLFHYLAENLKDEPILLLGIYRPEDVHRRDFFNDIIGRMRKKNILEQLTLEPLTFEESKEVIQGLIGRIDLPEDFLNIIYEISEGNPLFLKRLTKHIMEKGIANSKEDNFPTYIEDIDVPEEVDRLVQRRIKKLDPRTLTVLRICSIIGEEIPIDLLNYIVKMDPVELFEHVDKLTDFGILEVDSSDEFFCFSHGLIHKAINEDIPKPLKKILHSEIVEAIEYIYEEEMENFYSELGFHCRRAKKYAKAYEYYKMAGENAEDSYAHQNAIDIYKTALEISEEGNLSEEKKWEIIEKLGDLYSLVGEYEEALDSFEKIIQKAPEDMNEQRILCKIARIYEYKGRFDDALDILEDYLEDKIDELSQESSEQGKLLNRLGWIKMSKGRYDSAKEDFSEALEIFENTGDKQYKAETKHALGTIYLQKGNQEKAKPLLNYSLEINEGTGDFEGQAASLMNLAEFRLREDKPDEALKKLKEAIDILQKLGDKTNFSIGLLNIGTTYLRKGDLEMSYMYYMNSLKLLEEIGHVKGLSICLNNLGNYHLRNGDIESALQKYKKSLEISEKSGFRYGIALANCNMSKAYSEQGDLSEAKSRIRSSLNISREIGSDLLIAQGLISFAEILTKEEDFDRALEKARKGCKIFDLIGVKEYNRVGHNIIGNIFVGKVNKEKKKLGNFKNNSEIKIKDNNLDVLGSASVLV